jgi:hypothetical protein
LWNSIMKKMSRRTPEAGAAVSAVLELPVRGAGEGEIAGLG